METSILINRVGDEPSLKALRGSVNVPNLIIYH